MTNQGLFPSDFIPVEKKLEKSFHLQYGTAIESSSLGITGNFQTFRNNAIQLRRQAEGLIDVTQFQSYLGYAGDTSLLNIEWIGPSPIPKAVNQVVGKFMANRYSPTFTPLDPTAINDLERRKKRSLAEREFKILSQEFKKKTGIPLTRDTKEIPIDKDEAQLWADTTVKDASCLMAENIWRFVSSDSFPDDDRERLYRDLLTLKSAVVQVCYDENGKTYIKYIRREDFGTTFSVKDDHSDSKARFHVEFMTIDQVIKEMGDEVSVEKMEELARESQNMYGNPVITGWGTWSQYYPSMDVGSIPWMSFKLPIINIEYRSIDRNYYKEETLNNGKYKIRKGKKDETTYTKDRESVYTCKKVMYKDIIFKYGLKKGQPREIKSKNGVKVASPSTEFSYVVISPQIYDMRNRGFVETIIPHSNQIILCFLKMQVLVAKAKPPGLAIDVATTTGIIMGVGGEEWGPLDLQKVYEQLGTIYYSSLDATGGPIQNPMPIRELPNGMSQDIEKLVYLYNSNLKMIHDITGMSDGMDGTMPTKDALVGIQKMVARNSNNALRYIDIAYESLLRRTVKLAVLTSQMMIRNGYEEIYKLAIGDDVVDTAKEMEGYSLSQIGVDVILLPDAEQIDTFLKLLDREVVSQALRLEDALIIYEYYPRAPKLAERMLISARKRYAKEKLEEQRANIQFTTEAQSKSAADAAKYQMAIDSNKEKEHRITRILEMKHDRLMQGIKHEDKIEEDILNGDIKERLIEAANEADLKSSTAENGSKTGVNQPRIYPKAA